MPSPLPRQVRWNRFAQYCSIDFGLPQVAIGSAPALIFSWPAQHSLTLRPTDSPSRLTRPSTPEAPTALLSPPPLRLLPGGAIQFPGGPFIPLWTSAFHGAPQPPDYVSYRRLGLPVIPKTQTLRPKKAPTAEVGACSRRKPEKIRGENEHDLLPSPSLPAMHLRTNSQRRVRIRGRVLQTIPRSKAPGI